MSDLQELAEELLQNPDFKAEYDALQSEMDITRSIIYALKMIKER